MSMAASKPYLDPRRLADVLVLIHSLGFSDNKTGQVYDNTLTNDGLKPQTASNWQQIAKDHPEFFRLSGQTEKKALILVIQYVSGAKPTAESLADLVDIAVKLHDRQVEEDNRQHDRQMEEKRQWFTKISILTSMIATVGSVVVAVLALILKR